MCFSNSNYHVHKDKPLINSFFCLMPLSAIASVLMQIVSKYEQFLICIHTMCLQGLEKIGKIILSYAVCLRLLLPLLSLYSSDAILVQFASKWDHFLIFTHTICLLSLKKTLSNTFSVTVSIKSSGFYSCCFLPLLPHNTGALLCVDIHPFIVFVKQ